MNKPYVGVTGFMSKDEIIRIMSVFPEESNRLLMAGILASTITLNGGKPERFFGRYPDVSNISKIVVPNRQVFNVIHFNDKTKDDVKILDQLVELTKHAKGKLDGFQLNISWPSPHIINPFVATFSYVKIILQIGSGAFKAVDSDPVKMAKKIRDDYGKGISYVLIDPSGGTGKEFDTEMVLACLRALEKYCDPSTGFGIAGGLSYDNMDKLLAPIVKEFPNISIDAEGKLRNKETDTLNIERAVQYVGQANKIFKNE